MTASEKQKLGEQLDRWIPTIREEFLRDVSKLCRIRSVSEAKDEFVPGDKPYGEGCYLVLMEALKMAGEYGFRTKNYENYAGSATYGENPQDDAIAIVPHMDIVPEGDGWTCEPFEPHISEDGKYIFGRGTADNKAPGVMALYAMRFLKEHGIKLKNNVMIVFGMSEETGSIDMPAFLAREKAPKWCLVPDAKYPVGYAEKGMVRSKFASYPVGEELVDIWGGDVVNSVPDKAYAVLGGVSLEEVKEKFGGFERISVEADARGVRVNATGTSHHCARPHGAINANDVLVKALLGSGLVGGRTRDALEVISVLTGDYDGVPLGIEAEDDVSGKLTFVLSMLRKEGDRIILQPDIRYPVKMDQEFLMKQIPVYFEKAGFEIVKLHNDPALYIPLDNPVIQKLIEVAREQLGQPDIPPLVLDGGTYARSLPNAVSYGATVPGRVRLFGMEKGGAHQADEYGDIAHLLLNIKVYVNALLEIDPLV